MNNAPDLIPAIADDGSLYPVEKLAAHREGLLHQAISVFVLSGENLLLQRRASDKYHCGGLWANTCCSHPRWGEDMDNCARRRLAEELGLMLPLARAGTLDYSADVGDGLIEHERVTFYSCDLPANAVTVVADPAEVSETRWVSLGDVRQEVRREPERFAPWFRIYLSRWPELGI